VRTLLQHADCQPCRAGEDVFARVEHEQAAVARQAFGNGGVRIFIRR